jgi:hypothetical protein
VQPDFGMENANWELIRYTNNAAGDLLLLKDCKNQQGVQKGVLVLFSRFCFPGMGALDRVTNMADVNGAGALAQNTRAGRQSS